MKQLKIITIGLVLIGIFVPKEGYTQDWDDIGNRWVYGLTEVGYSSSIKFQVEGDTMIDGLNAVRMGRYVVRYIGVPDTFIQYQNQKVSEYIYRYSNDSVFWHNTESFQFIYSLSPKVGDTWTVDIGPNSTTYCLDSNYPKVDTFTVDSSYTYQWVDGSTHNLFTISSTGYWDIGDIIENVGPYEKGLLPLPNLFSCNQATGYPLTGFYMCGDLLTANWIDCVDLLVSSERIIKEGTQNDIVLYPNPTSGELNIKTKYSLAEAHVYIYDLMGRLIQKNKINKSINISHLPKGIYLIQIIENNQILSTQKIIKQ